MKRITKIKDYKKLSREDRLHLELFARIWARIENRTGCEIPLETVQMVVSEGETL